MKTRIILSALILTLLTTSTFAAAQTPSANMFAELRIKKLADENRLNRKLFGWTLVGIGTGLVVLSSAPNGDKTDALAAGSILALSGVGLLVVENPIEKEYSGLQKYSGIERQKNAEIALERLSKNAKRARIMRGCLNVAAGLFLKPGNYIFFASSLFDFLRQSPAEYEYAQYSKEKK